jgi:hypothetical protein
MYEKSIVSAICVALSTFPVTAIAQEAGHNPPPPVGTFSMPLVSPGQAERFLAERVVPRSDVSSIPSDPSERSSGQPPVALNVAPVLGHELPTSAATQWGLPRAAFAISKPGAEAERRKNKDAALGADTRGGPARATIRNIPPGLGGKQ